MDFCALDGLDIFMEKGGERKRRGEERRGERVIGGLATWTVGRANSSIIGCGLLCFGWFGYPERGGERRREGEKRGEVRGEVREK